MAGYRFHTRGEKRSMIQHRPTVLIGSNSGVGFRRESGVKLWKPLRFTERWLNMVRVGVNNKIGENYTIFLHNS